MSIFLTLLNKYKSDDYKLGAVNYYINNDDTIRETSNQALKPNCYKQTLLQV